MSGRLLPGMPLSQDDVHMCTTEDIEQPPAAAATRHAAAAIWDTERLYGVWLVLTLCRSCDAKTGRYCAAHRGRRG